MVIRNVGRLAVVTGVVLLVAGGCGHAGRDGLGQASTRPAVGAKVPVAEGEVAVRLEVIRVTREGVGVRVRCTNNSKQVVRISSWSLSWLVTQVQLGAPDCTFWQIAAKGRGGSPLPPEEDYAVRLNPGESVDVELPSRGLAPQWRLQSVSSRKGEVPETMRFEFPAPLLNVADAGLGRQLYVPITTSGTTRVEVADGAAR